MNILENIINEIEEKELKESNNIIIAPSEIKVNKYKTKVFLGGTIDSGNSEDWQKVICKEFINNNEYIILNPRRDNWPDDGSEEVIRQIKWEHKRMDEADIIVMNLLPDSKSPISLMEIGMYNESGKLLVFCTDKFYRFDNVKIVCEKYKIELFETNDNKEIVEQILKHKK